MPFVAECLFCKGMVRVPDRAAGWSVECPKCGSSFTVIPMRDPPPEAAVAARPALSAVANLPLPPPVSTSTADPPALLSEAPSPPLPHALPRPPPVRMPRPSRRPVNYFGLTAFALGSFAILFVQIPGLGLLAVPMCLVGLLAGLLGLAMSDAQRGLTLSIAGLGICALLAGTLLLRPTWLGMAPRGAADVTTDAASEWLAVPLDERAGAAAVIRRHPSTEAEWIDASRHAILAGDVRVRVTGVTSGLVEFKSTGKKKSNSAESCLQISVRLTNVGVARRFTYQSWGEPKGYGARLFDASGKAYPLKAFGPGRNVFGHLRQATLAPGKFSTDMLVFELPSLEQEFLRLELPAAAFGAEGELKLQIPKSMIH